MFYKCFGGSRPGAYIFGLGAATHFLLGLAWAILGSSWAFLGLFFAPLWLLLASSWPPLGSFGVPLGRSGTRVFRSFLWVSLWDLHVRPRGSKKPSLGLLGLFLASSWLLLGFSWHPLGLLLALLGFPWDAPGLVFYEQVSLWDLYFQRRASNNLLLGSSWPLLAPVRFLLGSFWLLLGSSCAPFGVLLGPLGFLLAALRLP